MLRINNRSCNDVVILDLRGSIAGRAQDALGERVRDTLAQGNRKLVLNVGSARSSGNTAISTLLGALLAAREVGGDVRLLNVSAGITDLPTLVALHGYFSVFESEAAAVASFRAAPATEVRVSEAWTGSVVAA